MNEEVVTLAMVAPILKLSKLQLRAVLQATNPDAIPGPDDAIDARTFQTVLLADLLERKCGFLRPEQRALIVGEASTSTPPGMIAFADGAYCVWDGLTGYLDLESGDVVSDLPARAVETIGYNLVALRERALNEIAKRLRHANKHPAGSVEEPGDFCDGAPDAVS